MTRRSSATSGCERRWAAQKWEAALDGFVDVRDELVYAAALARFEADVARALGRAPPPWAAWPTEP